ncbi:hypothetical protein V8F06_006618 [Rhypophila decipiens]
MHNQASPLSCLVPNHPSQHSRFFWYMLFRCMILRWRMAGSIQERQNMALMRLMTGLHRGYFLFLVGYDDLLSDMKHSFVGAAISLVYIVPLTTINSSFVKYLYIKRSLLHLYD